MKRRILLLLLTLCVTFIYSCTDISKNDNDLENPNITFIPGKISNAPYSGGSSLDNSSFTQQPDRTSGEIKSGDDVFEYTCTTAFFDKDTFQHGYNYANDSTSWIDTIESRFGIKLKITSMHNLYKTGKLFSFSFQNEINTTIIKYINNGTIKGLFKVGSAEYIQSLADEGLILPIDPYLQNNSNWKSLPEEYREAYQINGLTYGLPSGFGFRAYSRFIRQDWLDNFNIQQPDTITDFYEVMKLFTYNDPDEDLIDNTFGFTHTSFMGLEDIFSSFDVRLNPNGDLLPTWNPNTNKWEDSMLKFQMEECFSFLKGCYDENLLVYDEFIGRDNLFAQGYSGSYCSILASLVSITDSVLEHRPESKEPKVNFVTSLRHQTEQNINGYYTTYFIPVVLTKNSEYPETTINNFIDIFMADRMGYILGRYGHDGNGFVMDGDQVVYTTFIEEGIRYAYDGPKIMYANPFHSTPKISDFLYDAGRKDINALDYDLMRQRNEQIKEDYLSYAIPWEVVTPDYTKAMSNKIDHMDHVTRYLFRNILAGAIQYDEALQEYRKQAKESGMQEFLDLQNSNLGASSWQSY